jgi:RNA polymerase sigma-70 factor, ECF subfamily
VSQGVADASAHLVSPAARGNPEQEAILADSVGLALLVVLDTLEPAERLAFVLHDMFAVSFDEIGSIVGRTPVAARQLASRARRRVRGARPSAGTDRQRQRQIAAAFLNALRAGDFEGLLALLDPDVQVRIDPGAVPAGTATEIRGAENSARSALAFARGARYARLALVNGAVGIVVAPRGKLFRVLQIRIVNGKIAAVDVVAEPQRLRQLELATIEG